MHTAMLIQSLLYGIISGTETNIHSCVYDKTPINDTSLRSHGLPVVICYHGFYGGSRDFSPCRAVGIKCENWSLWYAVKKPDNSRLLRYCGDDAEVTQGLGIPLFLAP